MAKPRFFLEENNIKNDTFALTDPKIILHAKKVLRLQKDDEIVLFSGNGIEFSAVIENISKEQIAGRITKSLQVTESWPHLILAQALPRAGKLDDIVRKNTELGVREFYFFESDYSVVKLKDFKANKIERLERVVQEAARQSERKFLPELNSPLSFADILDIEADVKLLLHSKEVSNSKNLNLIKAQTNQKVLLLVGPEGGFSTREIEFAQEKRVEVCYMNLPILRTENAGFAAGAVLLASL